MSCCSVFGKWAHFPKGIAGAYSQWKPRPWPVEARSAQAVENRVSGAPIIHSHPQTKHHCWSLRNSVRKGHFRDCVSRPGDLKCQGTGGPDGHQRDQLPGSTGVLCCSLEFAWKHPQPRDLNREAGTASLKVMAGGGENKLSSAPESRHHHPLHTAVPTAAPWHQGSLTMLPVQLGMNWGRWTHSPESSALWLIPAPISLTTSNL